MSDELWRRAKRSRSHYHRPAAHSHPTRNPAMPQRVIVLDGYTLAPTAPAPGKNGRPRAEGALFDGVAWSPFESLGVELVVHDRTEAADVASRAAGAALVLTNKTPMTADSLAKLPDLKYVGVLATGTNVVDLKAARERGVAVTNVPGYSTDSVAQLVFALILELACHTSSHGLAVHDGQWESCPDFSFTVQPITELAGKTLGVIGMGAIGRRVAAIGAAMGMKIAAAHQRTMDSVRIPGVHIEWMPNDNLFSTADVITLHCPLTDQTRQLVNAQRIGLMKKSALLINTGRGPLVDEVALAEALKNNRIGGAGLDVLSVEPPTKGNPLLRAPRCLITPHIAWASVEARRRLMQLAADNLAAFLAGRPTNVVN